MNSNHLSKLNLIFSSSATLYLLSLWVQPYGWQWALKTLPIVVLLVAAVVSLRGKDRLLAGIAVLFSAFGDLFLALSFEQAFILGLGSFLIAQLLYAILFHRHRSRRKLPRSRKIWAIVAIIHAGLMAAFILPATGDMLLPVIVYLLAILAMAITALRSHLNPLVPIGAFTFLASDSFLATNLFRFPHPILDLCVMATYYLAQYFIVNGIIVSLAKNSDTAPQPHSLQSH